jgi:uridylate kinase
MLDLWTFFLEAENVFDLLAASKRSCEEDVAASLVGKQVQTKAPLNKTHVDAVYSRDRGTIRMDNTF